MERFAFCTEFGGNLWRMLIFGEQLEERIVPHFAGAQIRKWFKELEGGIFKPIDDEQQSEMEKNLAILGISLQLDGLDRDICLKIRLPVSIKFQSFGFLRNCPKITKFVSTIDPSIHGNVHFDIGHLDQTKKFLAFISLQSFNCPSTVGNESNQKWSIRSPKDIVVESERGITGQSPDQPEQEKHFEGIEQCPPDQTEDGEDHFVIPPSQTDGITNGTSPMSEGLNYVSPIGCQPNAPAFVYIFVCWKLENDSTTFVGFNGGVNLIKCAKNQLNFDTKLGEWYKIEYCHRNDQIFILNIQPTLDEEKLFKTRVDIGIVQFEIFIRKTPNGFETFEGGVKVIGIGMPAELQDKSALIGWCTLEEESKNVLMFCEESHQKTSQSQAQNNSEMVSTNGSSKNSIEGEAASVFPIQNNSKIVLANAKFSIKEGGFGRGRPRHDRLLTNLAKVDGKYNDLATLEDHSMANVKGIYEDKSEMENMAKVKIAETEEINKKKELPEPIEIAFPEHLIDFIMKEEGSIAKGVFECELEKSTVFVNGIQILGSSKETMMKCAKYIKTIRDLLIKGNHKKMEEKATNLEENIEKKDPNKEGQKPILDKLLDEFHSEHREGDWLDMIVAQEDQQRTNLVKELMERTAPSSVEAIICEKEAIKFEERIISIDEERMALNEQGRMPPIDEEAMECDVEIPKLITQQITLQQKIKARPPPLEFGCKYFRRPNDKGSSPNVSASSSFSSSKFSPPTKLVHVPKNYHSLVIGKNGNNLNRLKNDFNVQIEIPAKLLPEENITISGNNPIQLDACKKDILDMIERVKMEEMPGVKDYVIIPVNDQKHEAVHYVKFLIGRNYCKITELRASFLGTYIEVPYPERGEEPIIRIAGLKRDVEEIKKHFDDQIEIFRNYIVLFVEVEEKQQEKFLDKKGKLLLELKEQHPECNFHLNKTENRIEIRGTLENAEKAKETVCGIICENQPIVVADPEISKMINQVYMDTFVEIVKQIAGGSK